MPFSRGIFEFVNPCSGSRNCSATYRPLILTARSRLISLVTSVLFITCLRAGAQVGVDAFNPNPNNMVITTAIQPDGKILVGGYFDNVGGQAGNYLARLNPDGSPDLAFIPAVSALTYPAVGCISLQPDGKILVGSGFLNSDGRTRNYLSRLNPNGTLDTAFKLIAADNYMYSLVVLSNGQILACGPFNTIGGQSRPGLARLNSDGTVDTNFNARVGGSVCTTALQPDGKIVVGGYFTNLAGASRTNIGRLNADGTLDAAFNPGADAGVTGILIQPDGNILVCGAFTNLVGTNRTSLGRLHTNGAIDTTFNPAPSGGTPFNVVYSMVLQTDGKIVVGGNFAMLGGKPQNFVGRLNTNGSLDAAFTATASGRYGNGPNPAVYGLALQADGGLVVCGNFTYMGTQPRNNLGRVTNSLLAVQSLSLNPGGTTLTWNRSGPGPEVSSVTFESSTDGANYRLLGSGSRISGGWQLTGLSISSTQRVFVRARGVSPGGDLTGSISLIESVNEFFGSTAVTLLTNLTVLGNGAFQFGFANPNSNFTVLATSDFTLPLSNWTVLGPATQVSPGHFQFTDSQAANYPIRFYRVRSP